MASAIREFLEIEKSDISTMSLEGLAAEVEGWRAVIGALPPEVTQILARLYEPCRLMTRNYQGHAGILIGVKFTVEEYRIFEEARTFDTIHGQQMLEQREVVIPFSGVSYIEYIEDAVPIIEKTEAEQAAELIG